MPLYDGFSYDATPPSLAKVTAKHGDRSVLLAWTASPDTQVEQVARSRGSNPSKLIYRGTAHALRDKGLRPGAKYHYTVTAFDVAGNSATKALTVTGTGKLVNPVPGERVSSRPSLAWLPVKGASYYNVQLIRGGRILTVWPRHAHFKLPRRWVYQGHHYRLRPGVYHWYVWPGFGLLAHANYGRMLGGSREYVQRHPVATRPGVYRWYVWPGFGLLAHAHYGRLLGGSTFVYGR